MYDENRSGRISPRTWFKTTIASFARLPRTFMKSYLNGKGWAKH